MGILQEKVRALTEMKRQCAKEHDDLGELRRYKEWCQREHVVTREYVENGDICPRLGHGEDGIEENEDISIGSENVENEKINNSSKQQKSSGVEEIVDCVMEEIIDNVVAHEEDEVMIVPSVAKKKIVDTITLD